MKVSIKVVKYLELLKSKINRQIDKTETSKLINKLFIQ